jgi:hypothetical protein
VRAHPLLSVLISAILLNVVLPARAAYSEEWLSSDGIARERAHSLSHKKSSVRAAVKPKISQAKIDRPKREAKTLTLAKNDDDPIAAFAHEPRPKRR